MCEMVLGDPLHRSSVMEGMREVWLPNLWQQIPSQIRVPSEQLPSSLPHTPQSQWTAVKRAPIPVKGTQEKTAEDAACIPAQPPALLQAMADASPPLPRALVGPLSPPANALPAVSWDSVSLDELEAHRWESGPRRLGSLTRFCSEPTVPSWTPLLPGRVPGL